MDERINQDYTTKDNTSPCLIYYIIYNVHSVWGIIKNVEGSISSQIQVGYTWCEINTF